MLRLGTRDIAGEDGGSAPVTTALVTRALGDLLSERMGGCPGFAIEQLCAAVLDDAPNAAQVCVDRLMECGVGVDTIFGAYIPGAAARLGEMWADDKAAFSAVTLAMTRLTDVYRRLSPAFLKERPTAPDSLRGGHALFALGPGETHALGVVMAADYFRRSGWSVRVELKSDADALERIVRRRPYDMIGLSAGSRRTVPELRRTVARLRKAAHPAARFLVGGPIVSVDAGIADEIGVDLAVGAADRALCELQRAAPDDTDAARRRDWQPFQA